MTDFQTGEPLTGAALKLDGFETFVATDSSGHLRLPVSCDEHVVKFNLVGYKPFSWRFAISGDSLQAIEMENIQTQIEEVVITSQSTVRTMETPALGVNILSIRAVQKIAPAAGEVDVLRGLQSLPGISAVGEGANGINIRGGAVDQNLILLDNMPIFNPTHLLGLFSLFPTDAIREMQIYKGSVPARYGGRTAGVLDVKMSEPNGEKFKMRGGIGLISNRIHVEFPLVKEKIAWMSSARFSFNDYLIRFYNKVLVGPVTSKRLPDNKPVFFDFANKITWRPTDRDNISLAGYSSYDSYQVDTLFGIAGIIPRQATMQYGHLNFALRWNHYFSEKLNLNVLAVRSRYSTSTAATDVRAGFDYDTRLDYHNGKVEFTYAPSAAQRIHTGVTLTRYDILPADLKPGEGSSVTSIHLQAEQAWEAAFFASDEYELGERLLAEVGFRYVHYWNMGPLSVSVFAPGTPKSPGSITDTLFIPKNKAEQRYGRFEPRLALRYILDKSSSVKIGYNRMNQFLQMIANNATPLPNVRWKTSNRYVPPSQSDLVSAGYFRDSPGRMWEWSVETYYRWQRSIFEYLNGAELNINPAVETQLLTGKAKAYGAELFVNKKKGVITGWMSYTYARSLQKISGDFPALQALNGGEWFRTIIDKPHTFNILLNFQAERHNSVSFTFVYSTGRPYTAPVSFYKDGVNIIPVYTDRNNARISDYHRLDFSWTITNPSMKERRWEGSWVVTIYNIYGRKNAFSYFFNPELAAFKPFKVSVFPTPLFSLTYNFKFE
ncbi:MAG: TonB-dependent receptor plug domain-containing protein [Lewinellaceae bacterium]|nr:TonB-dependent receptor plug domain-containing protein [Lewinellaceae bacterium]